LYKQTWQLNDCGPSGSIAQGLRPNWAQGHDFTPCWLVMLLQITFPFLLLHGEADRITDPDISKELYKSAKSFDKEFKLYPGMWHGLTSGEPDENIDLVFTDIIHWLNKRSPAGSVRGSPLRHADVSAVVADSSSTASKREPDLALEFKLNDSDQQKKLATSTR